MTLSVYAGLKPDQKEFDQFLTKKFRSHTKIYELVRRIDRKANKSS